MPAVSKRNELMALFLKRTSRLCLARSPSLHSSLQKQGSFRLSLRRVNHRQELCTKTCTNQMVQISISPRIMVRKRSKFSRQSSLISLQKLQTNRVQKAYPLQPLGANKRHCKQTSTGRLSRQKFLRRLQPINLERTYLDRSSKVHGGKKATRT